MCRLLKDIVKNCSVFVVITTMLCAIVDANAQENSTLRDLSDSLPKASTYTDSIKSNLHSLKETIRKDKDSSLLNLKHIERPPLKEVSTEVKDRSKQATLKVKDEASGLFDGEGITNENAQQKVTDFLSNTSGKGNLEDQANKVLQDGFPAEDTEHKIKQLTNNPEKSLENISQGVDLDNPINSVTRVFNDKEIKFAYDSLLTKVDWNVVNALLKDPQAVSNGSILEAVFVKFPGLTQVSKARQDATAVSAMVAGVNPTTSLASLAAIHLHDLRSLRVDDSLMASLPPLRGKKLDARSMKYAESYWRKLDSLRDINLKEAGLKLKEKKLSGLDKESIIKKRLGFLQKIYFEGIIGLFNGAWNGNLNLIQLSPSLGYHLSKNISVGMGPSVILQLQDNKLSSILGMRSFGKYELLKYNLYFQLEHNMQFPHVDKTSIEEKNIPSQHAVLGGIGYLFPISKRLSINMNIMYRISGGTQLQGVGNGSSPWVYRIGISSNRINKNI